MSVSEATLCNILSAPQHRVLRASLGVLAGIRDKSPSAARVYAQLEELYAEYCAATGWNASSSSYNRNGAAGGQQHSSSSSARRSLIPPAVLGRQMPSKRRSSSAVGTARGGTVGPSAATARSPSLVSLLGSSASGSGSATTPIAPMPEGVVDVVGCNDITREEWSVIISIVEIHPMVASIDVTLCMLLHDNRPLQQRLIEAIRENKCITDVHTDCPRIERMTKEALESHKAIADQKIAFRRERGEVRQQHDTEGARGLERASLEENETAIRQLIEHQWLCCVVPPFERFREGAIKIAVSQNERRRQRVFLSNVEAIVDDSCVKLPNRLFLSFLERLSSITEDLESTLRSEIVNEQNMIRNATRRKYFKSHERAANKMVARLRIEHQVRVDFYTMCAADKERTVTAHEAAQRKLLLAFNNKCIERCIGFATSLLHRRQEIQVKVTARMEEFADRQRQRADRAVKESGKGSITLIVEMDRLVRAEQAARIKLAADEDKCFDGYMDMLSLCRQLSEARYAVFATELVIQSVLSNRSSSSNGRRAMKTANERWLLESKENAKNKMCGEAYAGSAASASPGDRSVASRSGSPTAAPSPRPHHQNASYTAVPPTTTANDAVSTSGPSNSAPTVRVIGTAFSLPSIKGARQPTIPTAHTGSPITPLADVEENIDDQTKADNEDESQHDRKEDCWTRRIFKVVLPLREGEIVSFDSIPIPKKGPMSLFVPEDHPIPHVDTTPSATEGQLDGAPPRAPSLGAVLPSSPEKKWGSEDKSGLVDDTSSSRKRTSTVPPSAIFPLGGGARGPSDGAPGGDRSPAASDASEGWQDESPKEAEWREAFASALRNYATAARKSNAVIAKASAQMEALMSRLSAAMALIHTANPVSVLHKSGGGSSPLVGGGGQSGRFGGGRNAQSTRRRASSSMGRSTSNTRPSPVTAAAQLGETIPRPNAARKDAAGDTSPLQSIADIPLASHDATSDVYSANASFATVRSVATGAPPESPTFRHRALTAPPPPPGSVAGENYKPTMCIDTFRETMQRRFFTPFPPVVASLSEGETASTFDAMFEEDTIDSLTCNVLSQRRVVRKVTVSLSIATNAEDATGETTECQSPDGARSEGGSIAAYREFMRAIQCSFPFAVRSEREPSDSDSALLSVVFALPTLCSLEDVPALVGRSLYFKHGYASQCRTIPRVPLRIRIVCEMLPLRWHRGRVTLRIPSPSPSSSSPLRSAAVISLEDTLHTEFHPWVGGHHRPHHSHALGGVRNEESSLREARSESSTDGIEEDIVSSHCTMHVDIVGPLFSANCCVETSNGTPTLSNTDCDSTRFFGGRLVRPFSDIVLDASALETLAPFSTCKNMSTEDPFQATFYDAHDSSRRISVASKSAISHASGVPAVEDYGSDGSARNSPQQNHAASSPNTVSVTLRVSCDGAPLPSSLLSRVEWNGKHQQTESVIDSDTPQLANLESGSRAVPLAGPTSLETDHASAQQTPSRVRSFQSPQLSPQRRPSDPHSAAATTPSRVAHAPSPAASEPFIPSHDKAANDGDQKTIVGGLVLGDGWHAVPNVVLPSSVGMTAGAYPLGAKPRSGSVFSASSRSVAPPQALPSASAGYYGGATDFSSPISFNVTLEGLDASYEMDLRGAVPPIGTDIDTKNVSITISSLPAAFPSHAGIHMPSVANLRDRALSSALAAPSFTITVEATEEDSAEDAFGKHSATFRIAAILQRFLRDLHVFVPGPQFSSITVDQAALASRLPNALASAAVLPLPSASAITATAQALFLGDPNHNKDLITADSAAPTRNHSIHVIAPAESPEGIAYASVGIVLSPLLASPVTLGTSADKTGTPSACSRNADEVAAESLFGGSRPRGAGTRYNVKLVNIDTVAHHMHSTDEGGDLAKGCVASLEIELCPSSQSALASSRVLIEKKPMSLASAARSVIGEVASTITSTPPSRRPSKTAASVAAAVSLLKSRQGLISWAKMAAPIPALETLTRKGGNLRDSLLLELEGLSNHTSAEKDSLSGKVDTDIAASKAVSLTLSKLLQSHTRLTWLALGSNFQLQWRSSLSTSFVSNLPHDVCERSEFDSEENREYTSFSVTFEVVTSAADKPSAARANSVSSASTGSLPSAQQQQASLHSAVRGDLLSFTPPYLLTKRGTAVAGSGLVCHYYTIKDTKGGALINGRGSSTDATAAGSPIGFEASIQMVEAQASDSESDASDVLAATASYISPPRGGGLPPQRRSTTTRRSLSKPPSSVCLHTSAANASLMVPQKGHQKSQQELQTRALTALIPSAHRATTDDENSGGLFPLFDYVAVQCFTDPLSDTLAATTAINAVDLCGGVGGLGTVRVATSHEPTPLCSGNHADDEAVLFPDTTLSMSNNPTSHPYALQQQSSVYVNTKGRTGSFLNTSDTSSMSGGAGHSKVNAPTSGSKTTSPSKASHSSTIKETCYAPLVNGLNSTVPRFSKIAFIFATPSQRVATVDPSLLQQAVNKHIMPYVSLLSDPAPKDRSAKLFITTHVLGAGNGVIFEHSPEMPWNSVAPASITHPARHLSLLAPAAIGLTPSEPKTDVAGDAMSQSTSARPSISHTNTSNGNSGGVSVSANDGDTTNTLSRQQRKSFARFVPSLIGEHISTTQSYATEMIGTTQTASALSRPPSLLHQGCGLSLADMLWRYGATRSCTVPVTIAHCKLWNPNAASALARVNAAGIPKGAALTGDSQNAPYGEISVKVTSDKSSQLPAIGIDENIFVISDISKSDSPIPTTSNRKSLLRVASPQNHQSPQASGLTVRIDCSAASECIIRFENVFKPNTEGLVIAPGAQLPAANMPDQLLAIDTVRKTVTYVPTNKVIATIHITGGKPIQPRVLDSLLAAHREAGAQQQRQFIETLVAGGAITAANAVSGNGTHSPSSATDVVDDKHTTEQQTSFILACESVIEIRFVPDFIELLTVCDVPKSPIESFASEKDLSTLEDSLISRGTSHSVAAVPPLSSVSPSKAPSSGRRSHLAKEITNPLALAKTALGTLLRTHMFVSRVPSDTRDGLGETSEDAVVSEAKAQTPPPEKVVQYALITAVVPTPYRDIELAHLGLKVICC